MKLWQWDEHKSITLTRYVVVLALLGSAAMTVCGPQLVSWLMHTRHLQHNGPAVGAVLLVLGYACAALAFWMLFNLYRFLQRLEQGQIFVPQTVQALRRISGCCAGAALLCQDGTIYTGCNIESSAYTPTICAERTAFFKAVSEGKREFICIAVTGGRVDADVLPITTPCGVCRQVMMEFCDPRSFLIFCASSPENYKAYTLAQLLPKGFGPSNLGI